ncbi:HAD family hydrolase [Roseobacter sp. HKCCD7415]|nr:MULTISPECIES: HAD family hydrolase [unclassified Roseobacter]NNV45805.1 HAD family hydrolase [Roseobacter sp. HKCCD6265]NNV67382.1 HAD family hydrolase [Roseobacter sp. HKCCD8474]NNV71437.1 HAD family hydrolase [Roseobacter sp. HKCCD5932]NNW31335.1 HAD family hydrolase [Roseobacter sp. HKCCD8198]NNX24793.1 HAD family hydrolase [Roseobacter sp. HKCCD6925]NNX42047.1 HAD family hydrolase [Roseobacter sp. HKCCD8765]NNX46301.1 HAD family hydrolase [Roseobacter sp. HKCCD8429]NNX63335.1 HAD fam
MAPKAVIFGGLGSLVECADLDRQAWNAAFRIHGVGWDWSWDVYAELMRPGGDWQLAARFADYLGMEVDAARLDVTHQRLFAARLADGIPLRPGVDAVLRWAAKARLPIVLVSRSEAGPVEALLKATARARAGIPFDMIILRSDVRRMAPDPEAMVLALTELGLAPKQAVAIVDTPATAEAAREAGLPCLAYPGVLAENERFDPPIVRAPILRVDRVIETWRGLPMMVAE